MIRVLDRPEPGFFALRTLSRKPWVPALICAPCPFVQPDDTDWPYHPEWFGEPLDRSPYPLAAKIGEWFHWSEDIVMKVWTWGRPITAQAYAYLMARRAWARRWAPQTFEAQPATVRFLRNY